MKRFLYATESGIFKGMQDVTTITMRQAYKSLETLKVFGRDGFISDKGITICSVCHLLLHECEIEAGTISHGVCPKHYKEAMEQIDPIPAS